MRKSFDDPAITHLAALLEAEAHGRPIDRRRAHSLAQTLSERYPDIRRSMNLVSERMSRD